MANFSQCYSYFKIERKYGILRFFLMIIYIIIYSLLIVYIIRNGITTRHNTGRSTNWDLTFGSFANIDTKKLADQHNLLQTNHQAGTIMNPLVNIGKKIQLQQQNLQAGLNNQKNQMSDVRGTFGGIAGNIINRISDATSVLQYLFLKLINLFERIFGIFAVLIYIMITTVDIIGSTLNGPIGFFACFESNTLINILEYDIVNLIPIKRLSFNNILQDRQKIISLMKFKNKHSLYNYQDISVSGSHLVLEQGTYQRVNRSSSSNILSNRSSIIYCLNTQNNIIHSNLVQFRDYNETNNNWINNYIKQIILRCLNLQPFKSDCKSILAEYYLDISNSINNHYYIAGFSEVQTIKLLNGNKKKISELEIDDILEDQQIVEGLIVHKNMTEPCYQIANIVVTGSTIIKFDNSWILVSQHPDAQMIDYSGYYYNIVTSNNLIKIDQLIFRDFMETNDVDCNKYIDQLVEEYLNNFPSKILN